MVNKDFWKGKKVFLTGHTGFKGSWLSLILTEMGSIVKGYSLEPETNPNLFSVLQIENFLDSEIGDIRNLENIKSSLSNFKPDILIHMAAQPLVRYSYKNPHETYTTNVIGTLNVLESARLCKNLKSILVITTDKCYENKETDHSYKETDPMGGYDPYSSSKGCCELLVSSYRRSFFSSADSAGLASVRAGNVIGGGDWSMDRLIPDIIYSIENKFSAEIRNPKAIRPWQHVLEPLHGYLLLAEKLYFDKGYAEAWNFGPEDVDCRSVQWVVENLINKWGDNSSWHQSKLEQPHEANLLKLDISKARKRLNWTPISNLEKSLSMIVEWQKSFNNGDDMKQVCIKQIKEYAKYYK